LRDWLPTMYVLVRCRKRKCPTPYQDSSSFQGWTLADSLRVLAGQWLWTGLLHPLC
jgi:hypothetical protein